MFNRIEVLVLAFMFLIFWACASKPAPVTSEVKREPAAPAPAAKEAWEMEWEKTLAQAKKEGKVFIYASRGPEERQALMDGFKKRTGLDIDMTTGRAEEIVAKLKQERLAGLYLVDVVISSPNTMLAASLKKELRPLTPELFLPEVVDTRLWYKGKLPFVDRENNLILQTRLAPAGARVDAVYNAELTRKSELVSWRDLLKPQFKGKMNMQDPTVGKGFNSLSRSLVFYGLDWDYWISLVRQEPLVTRNERLQVEWVAQGKHLVGINPDGATIDLFKKAGALIDFVTFKETTDTMGGGSFAVALPGKPAHPNAARIFVNWFLSKEGQTIFSRATLYQSAREDVPTDHLMEGRARQPGVNYPVEDEEFYEATAKLLPRIMDIFRPLMQ